MPLEAAKLALEASTRAELAANIAKNTAESVVTEMRERLGAQNDDSKEFRDWMRAEWALFKTSNDAFKTDFDEMNLRCKSHDEVIYGNEQKNIAGVIPRVDVHDTWLNRGLWTWGILASLASLFFGYMILFHSDDMKRGIFNPTDEERDRAINRQVSRWLPNQRWPGAPTPSPVPSPAVAH